MPNPRSRVSGKSLRWHDGLELEGLEDIWMNAARSKIRQLKVIPIPSLDTTHVTYESVDAAERALGDAQAALRAGIEAEEVAIEHAKQALRNAYAADDETMRVARLALRQQRNSLLPVARLPTEILRDIFTLCSNIDRPWMEAWPTTKMGWLAVTRICQRWRNIALEHPGLWTHVLVDAFGPVGADAFADARKTCHSTST
ncbi:hypothetical protein FA95DRAFT_694163 [Auriscalpium vulgare]|uniref:Uncharacterized protein n=1 Tax=Auriscalpium vulgare TaxID=40419 RepID=A0ACB8RBA0_9AGAM|nr:hypothetical protein FA95DRAFT_694163 [Auriscalpium vulgare]